MFIFRRKNETGAVTFYQPPDMIWWQVRQDWEMVVFSFVCQWCLEWEQTSPVPRWRSGRLQVCHPDPNHLGTLYGNCTESSPATWAGSGASRSRSATSVSLPAPLTEWSRSGTSPATNWSCRWLDTCPWSAVGLCPRMLTQSTDLQIISAGNNSNIQLWDLAVGKTIATLTNHKKSVRGFVAHPRLFMFAVEDWLQLSEDPGSSASWIIGQRRWHLSGEIWSFGVSLQLFQQVYKWQSK